MRELPPTRPFTRKTPPQERREAMEKRIGAIRQRMKELTGGLLRPIMERTLGFWAAFVNLSMADPQGVTQRQRLEDLDGRPTTAESETLPSYEEMRRDLERRLGMERLRRMIPVTEDDLRAQTLESGRREEEQEPRLQVRGFEQLGLSNESIRRYVVEGFPRTWTSRTAVTSITYTSERIPLPERYGIRGYSVGNCTLSPDGTPSEIVITVDALGSGTFDHGINELLRETIPHELAHGADWLNAAHLDPRVRLELLWRVVAHLHQEHRERFPYVESIHNADARQELEDKATEWIAEAVRMNMRGRGLSEEAEHIVRRMLPGFDWEAAWRSRRTNRATMQMERSQQMLRGQLERIENHRLRAAMLDAFNLTHVEVRPLFHLSRINVNEYDLDSEEVELDSEEVELWNAYHRALNSELARLHAELPVEARPAFEAWVELARNMTTGRERFRFSRGADTPLIAESAKREETDVEALNEALRLVRDDRMQTVFDVAAHRALRMISAGDVHLPPEMERQAEEWLADNESFTR